MKDLIAVKIDDATHGCSATIFFHISIHPKKELYCWRKFRVVLRKGPKDLLFGDDANNSSNTGEEEEFNKIDQAFFSAGNQTDDIKFVQNQGLVLDDDIKPEPENITQEQVSFTNLIDGQSWEYNRIDWRATSVPFDQAPIF